MSAIFSLFWMVTYSYHIAYPFIWAHFCPLSPSTLPPSASRHQGPSCMACWLHCVRVSLSRPHFDTDNFPNANLILLILLKPYSVALARPAPKPLDQTPAPTTKRWHPKKMPTRHQKQVSTIFFLYHLCIDAGRMPEEIIA